MYDNRIWFDDLGANANGVPVVNVMDRDGNPLEYDIPLWQAHLKYKSRYSPAIASMMGAWDAGDPYGSAHEFAYAVAQCGRALDNPEPARILNFRPSPIARDLLIEQLADGQDEDAGIALADLASNVQAGIVTEDDLVFAAKVLHRYLGILEAAGLSY